MTAARPSNQCNGSWRSTPPSQISGRGFHSCAQSSVQHSRRLGVVLSTSLVGALALAGFPGWVYASPGPGVSPSPVPSAAPSEFHDEIERDFSLRSTGQLQVTNMRGDIVIQGWSLDKIRVRARRHALAVGADEAKRLFSAVDFRFSNTDGMLELAADTVAV